LLKDVQPTAGRRAHRGKIQPLTFGGFLAVAVGVGGEDGFGVKQVGAVAEACL
jgi:hypothetical protein